MECLRWHRAEVKYIWVWHANQDAKKKNETEKQKGRGKERMNAAVDESRK